MKGKGRIGTMGKRAPDGAFEIVVTGEIGGWGSVNAEFLLHELQAAKPDKVRFVIYSPGGYIVDAITIAGWLQANEVEVYAEIYGFCASAATVFAAIAGPERTEIADGSMVLLHMPYGGDADSVANATAYLSGLYAKAYGWTEEEALAHMQAANGNGIQWTAEQAAELGIGKVMEAARIAARHKIGTMTKEKAKITAKVKLSTMEAIRAAVGEGATVEVDADEATASAIAEKDATIAELTAKVTELEGTKAEEAAAAAEVKAAKDEATKAKADMDAAAKAHAKAVEDLKAQHAAAITELRKPLANATVPDNTDPKADARTEDPAVKSVKSQFVKGMTPIAKAQYEKALKARAEKEGAK